mmetsp:Transcript_6684/g.15177  ORF Transcript_6684/g.15177 Transcript_6684/m.15177 type:complete len:88 (+) Transcript_6684:231-494(+)
MPAWCRHKQRGERPREAIPPRHCAQRKDWYAETVCGTKNASRSVDVIRMLRDTAIVERQNRVDGIVHAFLRTAHGVSDGSARPTLCR